MTPLKRVARAVRDEIAYPHGDGTFVVEGGFRDDQFFRDVARAVIEAIREPSMVMMDAGTPIMMDPIRPASVVYQVMIDALLEEGA